MSSPTQCPKSDEYVSAGEARRSMFYRQSKHGPMLINAITPIHVYNACKLHERNHGKTTESDRHANPNPSPFCMEWKQASVLLVVVRYGSLPETTADSSVV